MVAHPRTCTSSIAVILTGVKPNLQLQWRNRGVLPSFSGKHAQHTPHMLCYLIALYILSRAGIGPATSHADAHDAASMILFHTLERVSDSWTGDGVSDAEAAQAGPGSRRPSASSCGSPTGGRITPMI